jgi:hypothetical protein
MGFSTIWAAVRIEYAAARISTAAIAAIAPMRQNSVLLPVAFVTLISSLIAERQ